MFSIRINGRCGINLWHISLALGRIGWTIVIYEALCFDVAQGRMNGTPNETRRRMTQRLMEDYYIGLLIFVAIPYSELYVLSSLTRSTQPEAARRPLPPPPGARRPLSGSDCPILTVSARLTVTL